MPSFPLPPSSRAALPLLLLLTLLGGCAIPGPVPSDGVLADVPSAWSRPLPAAAGTPSAAGEAWFWPGLGDPTLTDLVARAVAANTGVASARAALAGAQAARRVAVAALWPSLDLSASAQRGRSAGVSTGNRFSVGADAAWLPDLFGGNRAAIDAATASADAQAQALGAAQVAVAAETALAYLLLRSTQARLAIATENLASQRQTLQIVQWRQQAGLLTELEVAQAQTAAAQTEAALPALQTAIAQTRHALAVLTGRPPAALDAALAEGAPLPAAPAAFAGADLPRIPAEALRHRADVRAAEAQVRAARAGVAQAEAARWPSFALSGSISSGGAALSALGSGPSIAGALLASVALPVFDGGARRARVDVQRAAVEQAQSAWRAAVLLALQQVEDALAAWQGDGARLAGLQVSADAAALAARLADQRFRAGLVDFQTVLETGRTRLSTQDGLASAAADVASDQVRLFQALGGGWPAGTDPPASAAPSPIASRTSPP